jgi:DNA-directed RNA polymerase specialized sigma24 family protein
MAEKKSLSKAAILQHYTNSDNTQSEAAAAVGVSIPTFIRERRRHRISTKKRVPANRLAFSDQEIVRRYFAEDQPTTAMLAAEFDCDAATIGNRIKAAGYELRPSNNIQRVIIDAQEARRLHDKEGLSQDEIAGRLKCSRPVVGRALRKARVKTRRGGALKKIHVDQATLRRMIVSQKMQYRDIAAILGCSKGTVARMRKEAGIPKAKELTPEERKRNAKATKDRWRAANIEHVRQKDNEYVKRRRQENPNARLAAVLRVRLRNALRNGGKRGSAVRDLGMDIQSFRKYIESLWAVGMSWENYGNGSGQWSLDHIFPLDEADLFDWVQFLAVNNWQNIQPLWSPENVSKGNSVSRDAARLFKRLCRHFATLTTPAKSSIKG